MDRDIADLLRKPFSPEKIGRLPRVTCPKCRESRSRNCESHGKVRCEACGNYITSAHMHLDYVGHAEITDRLIQVDPEWNWEPVALTHEGVPFLDPFGGLWIRLTVAGVTRLGYGHADGKKGPDAIKEAIGDALRNSAMRFGVALDLWGAKFDSHDHQAPVDEKPVKPPEPMSNTAQRKRIAGLWEELGYKGEEHYETRRDVTSKILGGIAIESTQDLTAAEADTVIRALMQRLAEVKRKQQKTEAQG
jgi:ribosomal protein S27E